MTRLDHRRCQHSVGEGSFHSGSVASEDSLLRYIYDCGAQPKYRAALHREIDDYNAGLAASGSSHIDLLFLSHAHVDHVNGAQRLASTSSVETVVMPLLSPAQRLIAFAHAEHDVGVKPADLAFYQSFVADPVAAAAGLGAARVIQVQPGGIDGLGIPGPPDGDDLDDTPILDLPPDAEAGVDAPQGWQLIGRGTIAGEQRGNVSSLTMPDTLYFRVAGTPVQLPWVLVTHVDAAVSAAEDRFLVALRRRLKITRGDLERALTCPDFLLDLVDHQRTLLADAYAATVTKNLNITSLSLYSGPETQPRATTSPTRARAWWWRNHHYSWTHPNGWWWAADPCRVGWLGTGDALLRQKNRRDRFMAHFANYKSSVGTFVLPHHGSSHNFHEDLLDQLAPRLCVVPADAYGNWQHPGNDVVASVAKSMAFPMLVTSDERTRLGEAFVLWP